MTNGKEKEDKMKTDEVFMNLLKEDMLNLRHQETQRMWIANIFVAIVVGTVVYLTQSFKEKDIPWFIPLIIFVISAICLLITLKLNKVFEETQNSIKNIFNEKKLPLGNDNQWQKYFVPMESTGIWKCLTVRCLYVILYLVVMVASLILFGFTLA
jgi:hypothetical protein